VGKYFFIIIAVAACTAYFQTSGVVNQLPQAQPERNIGGDGLFKAFYRYFDDKGHHTAN
jgi:hypothetical protein